MNDSTVQKNQVPADDSQVENRIHSDRDTVDQKTGDDSDSPKSNNQSKTQEDADTHNQEIPIGSATEPPEQNGVRVCDDVRYDKYFKMKQFGVPAEAVKLKMSAEGLDPSLLE